MTKEPSARLRSLLRILLSISLVVAGVCLMAACLGIYHSGDHPFSREAVAAAFGPISLPVYVCLGLMVLSVAAELLLPRPAVKTVPRRQTAMILRRMQQKTDLSLCGEELRGSVLAQRHARQNRQRIGIVLLLLCSAIFLSYGANPHNFHQTQINESMIRAMYRFLPCTLIPFGYGIFAAYRNLHSMEAEIELLKTAPKESKIAVTVTGSDARWTALRNVLLVVGLVILVYGFFAGGTADVLTKAVNICTECVGLG